MKKATLASVVLLLLIGNGICITRACQNYQSRNHQRMVQAMQEWKGSLDSAHLEGKSAKEVATYLDSQKVPHEQYSGLLRIGNGPEMGQKEGFFRADAGAVARTFHWTGFQVWHIKMMFIFNPHNNYKESSVWAEAV